MSDDSFDVVHAHQVLQHLTDPVRALTRWPGCAGPVGGWRRATPTTRRWRGSPRCQSSTTGACSTGTWRGPTAPSPMPAGDCVVGPGPPGSRTSACPTSVWTYADDAACRWWGESQAERYVGRVFAEQAAEHGVDCRAAGADRRRAGDAGATPPTRGSRSCTASCWRTCPTSDGGGLPSWRDDPASDSRGPGADASGLPAHRGQRHRRDRPVVRRRPPP